MSTEIDRFDDPALSDAIKKAFGLEKAPDELRQRIIGLVQQAAPAQTVSSPRHARLFAWRSFVTSLAAGFILVMAGIYLHGQLSGSTTHPQHAVLQALVETHDACCSCESHSMPGLPAQDIRLAGQTIGQQLHEGVLAADLSDDGWTFKGASICKINGEPAAHFFFGRRRASMSVFSLPRNASANMPETATYSGMIADHCVAAFVQNGQLYCMVGFCPNRNLKVSEVATLLQKHRAELVSPGLAAMR